MLALVVGSLALIWQLDRQGLALYRAHLAPELDAEADRLQARWFGVSAVLIEDGAHAVFVDPFFSRPGGVLHLLRNPPLAPDEAAIGQALAQAGVTRLDAVLVSHSHYDHAMDAAVVARLTGARLIGSPSTLNIGRGAGLAEERLIESPLAAPLRIGPWALRFYPSRHAGATGGRPLGDIDSVLEPPARLMDYRQGGTYSILIEHAQARILHHGSAGFEPGALREVSADVVFLGVALIDEPARYLAETVDAVGAGTVIPVHWDDFTRPLSEPLSPMPVAVDLPGFFAHMRTRPDLRVRTLRIGQPLALGNR